MLQSKTIFQFYIEVKIPFMDTALSSELIDFFDIIGTIACAVAGTIKAKNNSGDVMGAIFISVVASVGGGTVRDLLLDNHPIFWMVQPDYLTVIIITSLVVQIFFHYIQKLDKPLVFFDALGAATFTIIGIEKALAMDFTPMVAMLMGITTATVGGILRDIICNEIPLLFRREIYISACLVGALVYFALLYLGLFQAVRQLVVIGIIFTVRMLAVYQNWQLPNITINRRAG